MSHAPLSPEQVRWIAHLSRLNLTDFEIQVMTRQMEAIVGYVDHLDQLDVTGVEPLAHPLPMHNVFRDDVPGESLSVDQALANAPMTRTNREGDRFYAVPAVLE